MRPKEPPEWACVKSRSVYARRSHELLYHGWHLWHDHRVPPRNDQGPGSIWTDILRADRGADRWSFHRLGPLWNTLVGVWPSRVTIIVLIALTPIEPRRLLQKTGWQRF